MVPLDDDDPRPVCVPVSLFWSASTRTREHFLSGASRPVALLSKRAGPRRTIVGSTADSPPYSTHDYRGSG